jgi:hypothetical protein
MRLGLAIRNLLWKSLWNGWPAEKASYKKVWCRSLLHDFPDS